MMNLNSFYILSLLTTFPTIVVAYIVPRTTTSKPLKSIRTNLNQALPTFLASRYNQRNVTPVASSTKTSLSIGLDANVLQGAGIALAGLGVGIALVAFTEGQGERAKARGGNLSDNMSTRIAGSLMEDVEVSSVKDLGGLTSQLEKALRESGNVEEKGLVNALSMTEEEKKKKAEAADDGW